MLLLFLYLFANNKCNSITLYCIPVSEQIFVQTRKRPQVILCVLPRSLTKYGRKYA